MKKVKMTAAIAIVGLAIVLMTAAPKVLAAIHPGHDSHAGHDHQHAGHDQHAAMGKMDMKQSPKPAMLTLESINSAHLPMVIESLHHAVMAVESGDKTAALTELKKAAKMLAEIRQTIAGLVKPQLANTSCPIMGGQIRPDNIRETLLRDYEGQKVAFCCAGCPSTWDKFSDAQKDAKLAIVAVKEAVWTCSMHPQIRQSKPGTCSICNMNLMQSKTQ